MPTLFVPVTEYTVDSGKKFPITVVVQGVDPKRKDESRLVWGQEQGLIDQKGTFSAPIVEQDTSYDVNVHLYVDTDEQAQIKINVKKAKPVKEKPAELVAHTIEPRIHGEEGNYSINFQVLNQNGKGYKCSLIISDESLTLPAILPGGVRQLTEETDKDGFYRLAVTPFTENRRKICVEVKGSDIDGDVELDGPKPKKKVGKFDPQGGFWNNLLQR